MPSPDGRIGHAEIKIGDSHVMLADQNERIGAYSPKHYGGVPGNLMIYVEDVDSVFKRAVDAGATVNRPLADQFYGDRNGGIEDPFGHHWFISTHIRDVSPEEMKQAITPQAAWNLGNLETEGRDADAADNFGFARQLQRYGKKTRREKFAGRDGRDHALGSVAVIDGTVLPEGG